MIPLVKEETIQPYFSCEVSESRQRKDIAPSLLIRLQRETDRQRKSKIQEQEKEAERARQTKRNQRGAQREIEKLGHKIHHLSFRQL